MKALLNFFEKLFGRRQLRQVPLKIKNVKYRSSPRALNRELDEMGSYIRQVIDRFYSPHNP